MAYFYTPIIVYSIYVSISHRLRHINLRFVYNTDHPLQPVLHGTHGTTETTEMLPFVYEIGTYATMNDLEQYLRFSNTTVEILAHV